MPFAVHLLFFPSIKLLLLNRLIYFRINSSYKNCSRISLSRSSSSSNSKSVTLIRKVQFSSDLNSIQIRFFALIKQIFAFKHEEFKFKIKICLMHIKL